MTDTTHSPGTATRLVSVSLPVADQDAALAFYVDVLGFAKRFDAEPFPGQRMVEVVPPGSEVGILLLPPDSRIPIAVRIETEDAQAGFARVSDSAATPGSDDVLRLPGMPPMFEFTDPDGNTLVLMEPYEAS